VSGRVGSDGKRSRSLSALVHKIEPTKRWEEGACLEEMLRELERSRSCCEDCSLNLPADISPPGASSMKKQNILRIFTFFFLFHYPTTNTRKHADRNSLLLEDEV
jgi:hypothetical protein